jgi:hypothetical protein
MDFGHHAAAAPRATPRNGRLDGSAWWLQCAERTSITERISMIQSTTDYSGTPTRVVQLY